jgi:nicotinate-nucleotide--dimethylbenzimidazole phosphoribosyltransferase
MEPMTSALPFDDFRTLLERLPPVDTMAAAQVRESFARMDKPKNSLGRLEEIGAWLAAASGHAPQVLRPVVAVFAGNHGIARHGVSARPVEATQRLVELAAAGGAAVNQVCIAHDLGLKVYDLALHLPTADFTRDAALDERGCAATMAFGMEAVAGGVDLLAIGDIGVGGSTAAAAIFAALYGGNGADWVGSGTGADAAMIARKADVIDRGLALHGAHLKDPLEILRRFGGREFAAIAGAILAARMEKVPVVLDGFAATAAAAILQRANPAALDHCLLSQVPAEPGHRKAIEKLGILPLLDLGITHGEGAGAALAAGMVKTAALIHSGMAAALPKG